MTDKEIQECRDALAESDRQGGEHMHPSWVKDLLEEVVRTRDDARRWAFARRCGYVYTADVTTANGHVTEGRVADTFADLCMDALQAKEAGK